MEKIKNKKRKKKKNLKNHNKSKELSGYKLS